MPVLELPGGGITRPKYDRVIANSLEELTAFRPEVPHVWGLVRGQFTRRYWDGVEWKVAGVIGSGPLASAPVASAENLGLLYLETGNPLWPNGRLYQSRYNGNMINNDSTVMADVVKPARHIVATADFDLELRFYADPANTVPFTGLFSSGIGSGVTERALWIERSNLTTTYIVSVYNSAGVPKGISVIGVLSGKWNTIRVNRSANTLTAYLNGTQTGTIQDLTDFVVNATTDSSLFAQLTNRSFQGLVCCAKLTAPTNGFTYDFSQGSGTVIQDVSGNANNGTLTDSSPANFWTIGWTPLQW